MGLMDSVKGLVDKGRAAVAKDPTKFNQAVDKAGDFVDQRTHGKYSDKIAKGKDAARKAVTGDQGPQGGAPGPQGGTPGPQG